MPDVVGPPSDLSCVLCVASQLFVGNFMEFMVPYIKA